jgi:O-antigen/teichoic acid export membrane protein
MALRLPEFSPVAWLTAERVTQQALWLGLFAILAPILGPRPYGLFSVVMVFIGFCEFVLGEAAVEALVTVGELDPQHMATANLTNCVLALVVGLTLFLLAPGIGSVFHDIELRSLIWSLVPLPVLSLLSAVPIALLRRSLQYKRLAGRSIVGLVIGGLFAIAVALAGAGVWALALQVLAQRLAEMMIAWMSVPYRFRLGWSADRFREMRPIWLNIIAGKAMMFAGAQLPRLLLGYFLGPSKLGLFVMANRFLDIILNTTVLPRVVVGRIELRKLRPDSAEFLLSFTRMVQDAALLSFPVLLGTTVLLPDLFQLWLGQRWLAGVAAAQLVTLSGLPLVFFFCLDAGFLAAKLSSVFREMAMVGAMTILVAVLCAAPFGLNAVCLALAVRPWLPLPYYFSVFRRRCHLLPLQVLWSPFRSLLGAVVMTGILSLPFLRPLWLNPKFNFLGLIAAGVIVYLSFLYRFSRDQLRAALAMIWRLRKLG